MNGPESTMIALHLREHAPRYFADLSQMPLNVQLVGEWARPASVFYRFSLGNKTQHRSVLVKVPLAVGGAGDQVDGGDQSPGKRPKLFPAADAANKFQLEFTALAAIQDYFDAIGDPRFGAIRILDVLPDYRAIVMEEVRDPSLRRLLLKASRLRLPATSIDLDAPFRNAGAWLRAYHALPKQDQVTTRHTQRADFAELIIKFAGFLGNTLGDEPFFQSIASTTVANALEVLPESLPLGLRHGDYAMRNILIGPDHRVTVLDTLAKARTSIYDDIAYFLVGLKTNWLQVVSQGLAFSPDCLARLEHEFLVGYFEQEPIPYRPIQLYEILSLLNKWSAYLAPVSRQAVGKNGGAMGTLRLALMDRYFRKSIDLLL